MGPGDILGGLYQIQQPIGQGGLGTIWLAYHLNLQKYVVVKKVHDRFTQLVNCRIEVDILKSLHHRYLPQVYDFFEAEDGIFTVMDYIPGKDLQKYVQEGYTFSEEQLITWLHQLLDVLDYLHTRTPKIIHCDIKPGNIMISDTGEICLIDFNISLDGVNNKELVGVSSRYAAPEQITRAKLVMQGRSAGEFVVDEQSDLYSLGAVFYRLMSGYLPEERRDGGLKLTQMGLPYSDNLCNLLDKSMENAKDKRFKSAKAMEDGLNHLERWSREYQKLSRQNLIMDISYAACLLILLPMMLIGFLRMKENEFFEAYDAYMEEISVYYEDNADPSAVSAVLDNGIKLLNDQRFDDDFKKYPDQHGRVLLSIGQGELLLEQNNQAVTYLKQAMQEAPSELAIYRDLAIAQALTGDTKGAEDTLSLGKLHGLSLSDSLLASAQIYAAEGNYEDAYNAALQVATDPKSGDLLMLKASSLAMDLISDQKDYARGITLVNDMLARSSGTMRAMWLRKGGSLALEAYQIGSDASYLKTGISYYEALRQEGYGGYADLLNLSYLYEADGQLTKARDLLSDMSQGAWKDSYEVYLRLSYVYYRIANEAAVSQKDYTYVRTCFNRAKELLEQSGHSVSEIPDMLQMEQLIQDLVISGWLNP
ncbi:MAG: protein kinase [Firmicutes bacterium]|nr:protein kinase [Bacillota bacterium]